ncbi:unnamed protein product [Effrenium voratum]|uniref:Uncharacterized protein n=1 Tax=Effrenium voratum TaxID=2562239 RepID=A0AA36HTY2_9DINO|nr:unnamed protein product [Effrenium voratum]
MQGDAAAAPSVGLSAGTGWNPRADTSACVQMEVGCLPTGQGAEVVIANSSVVLVPSAAVASGETFQRACGDFTNGEHAAGPGEAESRRPRRSRPA